MSGGFDEGVFGPEHRRYRSRHSYVEAQGDSLERSKFRFANGARVSGPDTAAVQSERGRG